MKILMLPSYCYPEQISSSHLTNDLLVAFEKAGITTEIYTPTPTRGIDKETRKKYKKIKKEQRYNGSVTIYRFPLFNEGKNTVMRALRYLIGNIIQMHKGFRAKEVDLIYSASTPPTQGLLCGRVKKKISKKYGREVPFIYNLQDVFPDSLVAAGMTAKGSIIWKIGRKVEDKTYKCADKIIVISDDIKNNIIAKGVPTEKIVVIPNWIDTDIVQYVSREKNKLFDELGIDRNRFIVVYAGNLGMAQGIGVFIDAAKQVNDVEFIIFGAGSSRDEYSRQCEGYNNIKIFPLLPRERVSEVYSLGNISLVSCKPGLGGGAVPSKTFSIMSASVPILLSFDKGTELWNLIENNNCGLCTSAGDVDELVKAIRYAKQHPDIVLQMGRNGRSCVEREYSKDKGTERIVTLFKEVTSK